MFLTYFLPACISHVPDINTLNRGCSFSDVYCYLALQILTISAVELLTRCNLMTLCSSWSKVEKITFEQLNSLIMTPCVRTIPSPLLVQFHVETILFLLKYTKSSAHGLELVVNISAVLCNPPELRAYPSVNAHLLLCSKSKGKQFLQMGELTNDFI